ncbi:MAG: radical SAM protein [Desulfurococcaceae archaeon]
MKIVLTAPATEMSEYNGNPAIGFSAGFSKVFFVPRRYLLDKLYRRVPCSEDYRVKYAPLGLRIIEASLTSSVVSEDEIGIVHPDDLEKVVNEKTRIIGIGVKDPLGFGYVSLTYSAIVGLGDPINRFEFNLLMKRIRKLKKKYNFHVVLGGPGAWQILRFTEPEKMGITCVVQGEGEEVAPIVVSKILANEPVDKVVEGNGVDASKIPIIRGATIYGAVEITRGCGRGCAFCSPTMQMRRDIPIDKVVRNIEVNLKEGQNKVLLVTEDLFLYGSRIPYEPNSDALKKLINSIVSLKKYGLEKIQVTHINLAAALYRSDLFKYISDQLYEFAWFKLGKRMVLTTEVGIETGSAKLIKTHMMGKAKPFKPEEWFNVVLDSLILLEENGWAPCATIIVGLPGETYEDAYQTLKLVEEISSTGLKPLLIPLLFVPLGSCKLRNESLRVFDDLMDVQVSIFSKCWKHNVKIWGYDHFKKYDFNERLLIRIIGLIYKNLVARRRWWRKRIVDEVYGEVIRQLKISRKYEGDGVGY